MTSTLLGGPGKRIDVMDSTVLLEYMQVSTLCTTPMEIPCGWGGLALVLWSEVSLVLVVYRATITPSWYGGYLVWIRTSNPLRSPLTMAWSTAGVNSEAWPVSTTSAIGRPRVPNRGMLEGTRNFGSDFTMHRVPSQRTIIKNSPQNQTVSPTTPLN